MRRSDPHSPKRAPRVRQSPNVPPELNAPVVSQQAFKQRGEERKAVGPCLLTCLLIPPLLITTTNSMTQHNHHNSFVVLFIILFSYLLHHHQVEAGVTPTFTYTDEQIISTWDITGISGTFNIIVTTTVGVGGTAYPI